MTRDGKLPDRNEARVAQLLETALQLHRQGRLPEAEQHYRRALQVQPDNSQALSMLGLLARQVGRFDAAEELVRRAIEIFDQEPSYHFNLGALLQQTGRQQQAVTAFERAIALNPDYFQAQYQLALAYQQLGELNDALRVYRRAVELDPKNSKLLVNMGTALNALGRTDQAIELYRKAIRLEPDLAQAHGNLGNALAALERYEEATAALEQSIALQPENPTFYANLGSCWLQRGDFQSARSAYQACLARNPADITALAMQAAIHNELGETDERDALLDYERLLVAESIKPPRRYKSLQTFNATLRKLVLAHPSLEFEPNSHTTQGGQQTGSLLAEPVAPPIKALVAIIREHIARYLEKYDASPHLASRRAPRDWRLDMWATVLHESGHQTPHIHPSGWLSGVYYVACPLDRDDPEKHGWIEFGTPPGNYPFEKPAKTALVEPREGLLVLFPSYFYHRTIPFDGSIPRVSIAFDVVRIGRKRGAVRTR